MSKLTKFMNHPMLFFKDAIKKKLYFSKKKISSKQQSANITSQSPIDWENLFKKINLFTISFPVNSIKIENEYIWPYLRNHLWVQTNFLSIGKKQYTNLNPYLLQAGAVGNLPYIMREVYKKRYNVKEIHEVEEYHDIDFAFLTMINSAEQVEVNNSIYNRITDPLYEEATKYGNAIKFEMIKTNSIAIKKIDKYTYKPLFIFPPHIIKSGYFQKISLHRHFFSLIKSKIPFLNITESLLEKTVDWEMHTRDYYIDLLKKLKPKVLFLHGFHYHAPLISAADYLGIITVDIQHGLQVGWNPLYNLWDEMPSKGYSSIPDYFAVWGEKEYSNIRTTFIGTKHKPIFLGNLWLEKQIALNEKMSIEFEKILSKYSVKILLIMQNQTQIPKLFLDLIEMSSNDFLWIIRHHPKGKKFKKTDFSRSKENVLISEEIDKAPWSALFSHIDICISEGSTLALESDSFGVTNIIISEAGLSNYKHEIDNGSFYFIQDSSEFFPLIKSLDLSIRESKLNAFKRIDKEIFFKELLGAARKKFKEKNV